MDEQVSHLSERTAPAPECGFPAIDEVSGRETASQHFDAIGALPNRPREIHFN